MRNGNLDEKASLNLGESTKIEYSKAHESILHHNGIQYQIFRLFMTIYLAVWGGYMLLKSQNDTTMQSYILLLGYLCGIFILVILFANRVSIISGTKKIYFFRNNFLFQEPIPSANGKWEDYPHIHKADDTGRYSGRRPIALLPSQSGFTWTIAVICVANAALFYKFDAVCLPGIVKAVIAFLFLSGLVYFLNRALGSNIGGH